MTSNEYSKGADEEQVEAFIDTLVSIFIAAAEQIIKENALEKQDFG